MTESSLSNTTVTTLANGVRVVVIALPHLASACVSVFVRTGSRNESAQQNGISHFIEHMAFKGTAERSCQQVNFDAERLGAEVNAHTDKDHTAYHMRGLAEHAGPFVRMLADIVRSSTFPEAELERERQVILHEFAEDEDDALTLAFNLFDRNCYGTHPLAQPVIGTRRNIEHLTRADLLAYTQQQYTGANVVVGVAGNVDADRIVAEAEAAFGSMPRGEAHRIAVPEWIGGIRAQRQSGANQAHVVLGFPMPSRAERCEPGIVAAALFGEGMSSPLLDQLRERRGLVYHAACSADVNDLAGQFVIETSTSPAQLDELVTAVVSLLATQADEVDAVGLQRARNQLAVRGLDAHERPFRRLEETAQDLFVHGRVRPVEELRARLEAVTAGDVRDAFSTMLAAKPSLAITGQVRASAKDRAQAALAARLAPH